MIPRMNAKTSLLLFPRWCLLVLAGLLAVACTQEPAAPVAPVAGSGDAAFDALEKSIIEDNNARHPSYATDLGFHEFDDKLEDFSAAGMQAEIAAADKFRQDLEAIKPQTLSLDRALDREYLIRQMMDTKLQLDTIRMWQKDPDFYSSGVTNAAYAIMKRDYAPADVRLKALIAREKLMPAALEQARKNLTTPVTIYTQIAIEQIDGSISLLKNDLPAAFAEVKDPALLADFRKANGDVVAALGDYKTYMRKTVLPAAKPDFAFGADTWSKAFSAQDMVDLPIDRLLAIAQADLEKNETAFQAVAHQIDAKSTPDQVLAKIEANHPKAEDLLATTQATLDSIRQFIVDHHILTIPEGDPARVVETPPFMRSTTSASMDTPGPFEQAKVRGLYNMTLPDRHATAAEKADFMRQWYYASISNVSVHEVYPGHYIQFLYAKQFPTDARKVFGANTNIEGWAHYCEQMMLDEGFHADDPSYRLAQLQDALLRDVRFIVGIRMHTQGMTIDEATKLFETAGHQPHPVAVSEAKRGTADALYGYYTLGKLMILKLRDDYKAKMGAAYTLQGFHDAFIKLGPLPLPLIRRAMLGEEGSIL
jgi:uncharacterized protein (DUF885 family)